jgi:hypothetical protein
MMTRTLFRSAKRFWDKHDIDIILGTSSTVGACIGYNIANKSTPSDTMLKIDIALLGVTCTNLITWACLRVPAMKVPVTIGAMYGYKIYKDIEKESRQKNQSSSAER